MEFFMITLDAGNVLLKPSQRKQLMARLKRAIRLGDRLGDFMMKISLRRSGRHVEMTARVHDRLGDFGVRARSGSLMDALHVIVRQVFAQLHQHAVLRRAVVPI
jgi:hypothetical protein